MEFELAYIAGITGATVENTGIEKKAIGFSVDSRNIRRGEIFVAIKGEKTDGHFFVDEALKKGAVAVMCEKKIGGPSILVHDCIEAIGKLARDRVEVSGAKVIGVTGSLGKTTTKEAIKAVLETDFQVVANEGNLNTEIGLPMTVLNNVKKAEIFILEMGARKKGDITRLCKIAEPDIAVVTKIAPVHLEIFGSLKNIIETKLEILENLGPGGLAVLNGDDDELAELKITRIRDVIYFGIRSQNITHILYGKSETKFRIENQDFIVNVPSQSGLYAALAAIKVGSLLGVEMLRMAENIASMKLPPNRLETFEIDGVVFINDSYNSNPAALESALEYVSWAYEGRKIAVIGDMKELGNESGLFHEQAGASASKKGFSEIIAVGVYAKNVKEGFKNNAKTNFHEAENWRQALEVLNNIMKKGDVVLIKGSRAMELDMISKSLKNGGASV